MQHRSVDGPFGFGAWGLITRVPPQFNWISQDAARSYYVGAQATHQVGVPDSPHEIGVMTDGFTQGEYIDKFIYGSDHKDLQAWGWSSVGAGNLNIGSWMMSPNQQFSDGGPLKRDVFAYTGNCLNNSMDTNELGMGSDGTLASGELWDKTMGPWFMYFNHTATSGTQQAAQALYTDAVAQYQAEAGAWPYSWFTQDNYAPASARGTVKGQLKISNPGNGNPTVAGTYIVLTQQPTTSTGAYDFQRWLKNYQYFTTTDSGGNFTLPNVIAGGSNYYLWAYGPGNAGTFLSQNLNGGNPPILHTLPSTPFTVAVTAGGTNNIGTFTWTEDRVGPTVFEIGYPDRKAGEFRHGDDFFEPEFSPQLVIPLPSGARKCGTRTSSLPM